MEYVFNYTDRPSRAVMYYRQQFVLLATRTGDLVTPTKDIVDAVLDDLEPLHKDAPEAEWGGPPCYLMLRGIWFDDAHGAITLYVEQMHDHTIEPLFAEEEIRHALHDGYGWYAGQGVNVEVYTTRVITNSDKFSPFRDDFYEKVKSDMLW